jgi:hypothetical protein
MFGEFVPADFARSLEQQRNNEKELADLLAEALKATRWDSPVLCDEAMTAWESARKDSLHNDERTRGARKENL